MRTALHLVSRVFPAFQSAQVAIKGGLLAKPNYQYEKRQRDMAKKLKKEEKARQKLAGKTAPEAEEDASGAAPPNDDSVPASDKESASE